MEEKGEGLPAREKKSEPTIRRINVPRDAGLFEDFRMDDTYIGTVGEKLHLKEGQEYILLNWSESGRRKYDGKNWDPITFKETITRNGEKIEIERFGWFGSLPRKKKEKKAGKPISFVGYGKVLIAGPSPEKRKPKKRVEQVGQYPMPGFEK